MLNLESVVEFFRWFFGMNTPQEQDLLVPVRVENKEEAWRKRRNYR